MNTFEDFLDALNASYGDDAIELPFDIVIERDIQQPPLRVKDVRFDYHRRQVIIETESEGSL